MERLTLPVARRIALAAQGFADPPVTGAITRRHMRKVLARNGLLQMDSVNVFERAHYLPLFSRLGPYPKELVDRAAYGPRRADRELFEYWGHEASLLPLALHPLLRWRMVRAASLEEGWGGSMRIMRDQPEFVAEVLRRVTEEGPMGAGALHHSLAGQASPRGGPWWDWSKTKLALEALFWCGRVTTATRRSFERVYDLTERVIPAHILDLPTPSIAEAQQELVRIAARALGVATEKDLRDYFRLRPDEGATAVRSLVAEGELLRVEVEGWRQPAYLWAEARIPRRVRASALLSPFDPLVWERSRVSRLFGFDYRIEIYVPEPKRVHGYYVLPFLHDEALQARVDLKADRRAGALRVKAAWIEPDSNPREVAAALTTQLRHAATWQGLSELVVEPRGDLAPALAAAVVKGR